MQGQEARPVIAAGAGTGATSSDEFGFKAVEKRVHVHDLHATLLHLMGLSHKDLTYCFRGRDFRLADVSDNALKEILA